MFTKRDLDAIDLLALRHHGRTLSPIFSLRTRWIVGEIVDHQARPISEQADIESICLCATRLHAVIEENRALRAALVALYRGTHDPDYTGESSTAETTGEVIVEAMEHDAALRRVVQRRMAELDEEEAAHDDDD